jgi:hypothetical protein
MPAQGRRPGRRRQWTCGADAAFAGLLVAARTMAQRYWPRRRAGPGMFWGIRPVSSRQWVKSVTQLMGAFPMAQGHGRGLSRSPPRDRLTRPQGGPSHSVCPDGRRTLFVPFSGSRFQVLRSPAPGSTRILRRRHVVPGVSAGEYCTVLGTSGSRGVARWVSAGSMGCGSASAVLSKDVSGGRRRYR